MVSAGGLATGYRGAIVKFVFDYVLHTSGCVVEGAGFEFRMATKEIATLVHGNRMGVNLMDRGQLHASGRNEIVHNTQPELTMDEDIGRKQQVVVLGDRTG